MYTPRLQTLPHRAQTTASDITRRPAHTLITHSTSSCRGVNTAVESVAAQHNAAHQTAERGKSCLEPSRPPPLSPVRTTVCTRRGWFPSQHRTARMLCAW